MQHTVTTKVLAVAIGGAIGAVLRFYVQNWSLGRFGASFPYGTMIVNLSGAFVIGVLMTVFLKHVHVTPAWRLFFVTGILGGYTTFSALTWETYALFEEGHVIPALTYMGTSVLGGMLTLLAGVFLGSYL
jgi:CrcB protein